MSHVKKMDDPAKATSCLQTDRTLFFWYILCIAEDSRIMTKTEKDCKYGLQIWEEKNDYNASYRHECIERATKIIESETIIK